MNFTLPPRMAETRRILARNHNSRVGLGMVPMLCGFFGFFYFSIAFNGVDLGFSCLCFWRRGDHLRDSSQQASKHLWDLCVRCVVDPFTMVAIIVLANVANVRVARSLLLINYE